MLLKFWKNGRNWHDFDGFDQKTIKISSIMIRFQIFEFSSTLFIIMLGSCIGCMLGDGIGDYFDRFLISNDIFENTFWTKYKNGFEMYEIRRWFNEKRYEMRIIKND